MTRFFKPWKVQACLVRVQRERLARPEEVLNIATQYHDLAATTSKMESCQNVFIFCPRCQAWRIKTLEVCAIQNISAPIQQNSPSSEYPKLFSFHSIFNLPHFNIFQYNIIQYILYFSCWHSFQVSNEDAAVHYHCWQCHPAADRLVAFGSAIEGV